jgi:hypothetical protein
LWHGLTALLVAVALGIAVALAATGDGGAFSSPAAAAFNIFAYFTIQSNIIVGATCLLLAIRPDRTAALFRVFRLDGLVMIIITAAVYHSVLAGLVDVHGWSAASNLLVHTAVPALAILGWLFFGPRRIVSWRTVGWSVVYPIFWLIFTFVRGAITHWYPYPFLDVDQLGYARAVLNVLGVTAAFLALAVGTMALDRLLARGARTPVADR